MMNQLNKIFNNSVLVEQINLVFMLCTFVLLGVFGIWGIFPILINKVVLIRDMTQNNNLVEANVATLTAAKTTIDANTDLINNLYQSASNDLNTQNYLVDFFDVASKSGFKVTKFVTVPVENSGSVEINAETVGDGDIGGFIQRLEKLTRITYVEAVTFSNDINNKHITTKVRIFNYSETPGVVTQ